MYTNAQSYRKSSYCILHLHFWWDCRNMCCFNNPPDVVWNCHHPSSLAILSRIPAMSVLQTNTSDLWCGELPKSSIRKQTIKPISLKQWFLDLASHMLTSILWINILQTKYSCVILAVGIDFTILNVSDNKWRVKIKTTFVYIPSWGGKNQSCIIFHFPCQWMSTGYEDW